MSGNPPIKLPYTRGFGGPDKDLHEQNYQTIVEWTQNQAKADTSTSQFVQLGPISASSVAVPDNVYTNVITLPPIPQPGWWMFMADADFDGPVGGANGTQYVLTFDSSNSGHPVSFFVQNDTVFHSDPIISGPVTSLPSLQAQGDVIHLQALQQSGAPDAVSGQAVGYFLGT